MDSDSDDFGEGLCETCRYIRVHKFFISPGQPERLFDDIGEILTRQKSCNFCRLIGHAVHQSAHAKLSLPLPSPHDLPSFNPYNLFPAMQTGMTYVRTYESYLIVDQTTIQDITPLGIYLKMKSGQLDGQLAGFRIRIIVELGVLEALEAEIHLVGSDAKSYLNIDPCFHAKSLRQKIDTRYIRTVLHSCSKYHLRCQSSNSTIRRPINIRLVDISLHCIVQLDDPPAYVALSYVWGGDQPCKLLRSNVFSWSLPRGMPSRATLPRTIRDAIILCESLEQRYLWVDSLCIIQDDPSSIQAQLQQMNLIYQCATVTVVAAAGMDANAGLPGISESTREPQQLMEKIQGLHLMVPLPSLLDTARSSFWKTRAWTYQEQMLSKRMLVFTAKQFYFQCNTDILAEDHVADTPENGKVALRTSADQEDGLERMISRDNAIDVISEAEEDTPFNAFLAYQVAIADYTSRNIGNPSDILNAFVGFSNALQQYAGVRGFVGGLSIMGLADALLWRPAPRSALVRRAAINSVTGKPFPSWSWAGWIGAVKVERESDVHVRDVVVSEWRVLYSELNKEDVFVFGSVEIDDFKDTNILPMTSRSWTLLHAPILQLRTTMTCEFQLSIRGPEWKCLCPWDASETSEPHLICVLNDSKFCVGNIVLDELNSLDSLSESTDYIFVAISKSWHPKANYSRGFVTRPAGEVMVYNVVIGQKCEDGVERKGIGKILAAEWNGNASVVRRTINLV